ncbi:MAG: NAD(P)-dependent oxidoreductase, partial [Anaerolineae bacterium]
MTRPVVAIAIGKAHYTRMMSRRAWEELERFADVVHHPDDAPATKEDLLALLPNADACLTSWDVARLDADVVSSAPRLRVIVHMGGSVKRVVSEAVWERGILVISTAPVLAEHVAETTLGLMIVGMKRIWPLGQRVREGGWRDSPYWPSRELYDKKVGIVGASNVGRHVIRLLQPLRVHILLYDPYLSEEEARSMGATKVELDELVREADVISLHAPALPATHHMIDARRLSMMKDNALL